jgi:hypothetical protein
MMDLINKVKGWFIMDEAKLFVICATLCIMTGIGAIGYYNIQSNAMMSRNIENGIVKGIDPVAVRCAYAQSSDNVCVAYAASKAHEAPKK